MTGIGSDAQSPTTRDAATQLVASALIEPALEFLHESPFLTGPFAPNEAERRFAPMMDQLMADRITKAANFPLIDAIVRRMDAHVSRSTLAEAEWRIDGRA